MTNLTTDSVRAAIEGLMQAGVTGDLSGLDRIYHNDMEIIFVAPNGEANIMDKTAFLQMMEDAVRDTNPEDHRWAKFHSITADGNRGHVAISRKVPLGGDNMILNLSIDLLHEDNRWQVTREVIFSRPNPDA